MASLQCLFRVNQHPQAHHPLDALYDLVVDVSQLSSSLISPCSAYIHKVRKENRCLLDK
jgi:hypothetical protein